MGIYIRMDIGLDRNRSDAMLENYFQYKVREIFDKFVDKYSFIIKSGKGKVNFKSDAFTFIVYFEKNFDIYIVFKNNDQKEIVDLCSIVDYLKNTGDEIYIGNNQVSNKDDVDFVLKELSNTMDTVLERLNGNKNLLSDVFAYQKQINRQKYLQYQFQQMSSELSKNWEEKNYIGYLEIYKNYKQINKGE